MKPTAQFFFFGFKVGRGKTAFLHRLFLCFLMVTISPLVPVTALVWADEAPVQGEAGVIKVQVLNSKDQPVAKAKITVTASKLQTLMPQKAQSFERVTAENGEATLPALLPGTYNMSIEAEGFEPFTERDIEVQSAAITQLSIQLTDKLTQSDTVEVKAESDKLVEQTSEPAKVVTAQVIKTSPYQSRTFDAAIPYVPNVIRGSDGKINIKGGREDQNALLINEADSTDAATGAPALSIPLESIDQVKVFTNPYLPEFGRFTGGVTKVETKRGGDKWKFEVNDFVPEPRFRGGKLFGFANFSPRIHFEGPIIKEKLFVSQGLEYDVDKKPVRGLASPNNETIRMIGRSFTQFDYIVNTNQTLTATVNFSKGTYKHIGLDFFNPQPVSPNQKPTDLTLAVVDRLSLSNGSFIETLFQYKRLDTSVLGKGSLPMAISPEFRDGNFFHHHDRITDRYELRTTDTWAPISAWGVHRVKIGVDFNYLRNSGVATNQPVLIRRQDGTLAQQIDYVSQGDYKAYNLGLAGFAQDQWLVNQHLSIDYGFRAEFERATAGINVSPRVSFSYAPTKAGNTVFRGGVGLFYDKVTLNALAFRNAPRQRVTTYGTDGTTVIGTPLVYDLVLSPRPNGKPNTGFDFAAARNVTYNFEFNQRLSSKVLLKVAYLDSSTNNDFYVSPVKQDGKDAIRLFNDGRAKYRSLETTANFKLSTGREFTVSYIRSRAMGELNNFGTYFGDFPDPVIRPNQYSKLPSDAPNRLLVQGRFKLPVGFTVSPIFDLHTGFPYSIRNENQDFVGVRNSDSNRFPRFKTLDVAVSKDIKLFEKSFTVTVSMFNVTNSFNPRNVFNNIDGSQFGTFFSNYRRFYRLDLNFNF